MFRLDNNVAVVTGGSAGIGRAIVQRFRDAGALVISFDRAAPDPPIDGVDTQLVDIADEAAFREALRQCADTHGQRIDILVNNAGIQPLGPTLAETTSQLLDHTLHTNVYSVLNGLNQVTQWMPRGGRIINNASFLGVQAAPKASAYGLSKNAIVYLTRVAAIELANQGITVNCVCPATINTPAVTDVPDNPELAWAERTIPMGRIGEPEEVAAAFHFLASPEAAYITGQALTVDGGATAGFHEHEVVPPPQVQNGQWVDPSNSTDDRPETGNPTP
jgi:NAD(P)-dependent dehydrogenase (short-subunit alcohol dehydrogenase family)